MEKILIFVGSAREGNSLYLANQIKESAQPEQCEVIRLSDYNISYCDGCLSCDEAGICHIKDGMNKLLELIDSSNKMILITPARWSLMSGDMKVFIDRLNPFAASSKMSGKLAYGFAIGQSDDEDSKSIELALDSLRYFCENAEIEFVGGNIITSCLMADDLEQKQETLNACVEGAISFINS